MERGGGPSFLHGGRCAGSSTPVGGNKRRRCCGRQKVIETSTCRSTVRVFKTHTRSRSESWSTATSYNIAGVWRYCHASGETPGEPLAGPWLILQSVYIPLFVSSSSGRRLSAFVRRRRLNGFAKFPMFVDCNHGHYVSRQFVPGFHHKQGDSRSKVCQY